MKRLGILVLVLCAPLASSQQATPTQASSDPNQRVLAPTYSDMYCAGFIDKENVGKGNYVVAGAESPSQTQFHQGDMIYLEGSGFQEGNRLSVLRELKDANRSASYIGQTAAIAALGQPYADLGRVRVNAIRGKTAIAEVEFSCAPIVPGDLLVPFQERPPVAFKAKTAFDRFPAEPGSVSARIVLARDFDYLLGTGHKVYISAGADKGVKVGDYFRAVRGYDPDNLDQVEELAYRVKQSEESQKTETIITKQRLAELPRRALAEMIVLSVHPTSSTAMITYALENVTVGDAVELEGSK